ncbi:hypothetical protein [Amycolatopsis suaedae]|uniref:Uncharacterized protein n=1 Tax=Amycolatopsis suaedae TaxID=2510978 RepID=A0A4V2ELN1_9PSEU|nr:hypothetical protein [Amycolatopsis suaedae]RZQ62145.1 hypothetical protein EWH70_21475 [Amycolatopsis suaedae]
MNEIASVIQHRQNALIHSGDDFGKVLPIEGWSGPAASNADSAHHAMMTRLRTMAAGSGLVAKAIPQAADRIPAVQAEIANAENYLNKYGFRVADDGAIVDTFAGGVAPPDLRPEDRERARVEGGAAITAALRTAHNIDADLTTALRRAERGEVDPGTAPTIAEAAAAGAAQADAPPIPGAPPPPPTDPGAGPHKSRDENAADYLTAVLASEAADWADGAGWTHAAKNLEHYLGNSGKDLNMSPDEMARDVASFRGQVDQTTAAQMRQIAEQAAANGTYGKPIPFSSGWQDYTISPDENKDWFYATGSGSYAVTGVATVHPPDQPGGQPRIEMDYKTHVFDRYNWDGGKSTEIGPFTVTDQQLAELHKSGLAQEYNLTGSTDAKHFSGTVPAPGEQPGLPPPPDNRTGGRTDPGR